MVPDPDPSGILASLRDATLPSREATTEWTGGGDVDDNGGVADGGPARDGPIIDGGDDGLSLSLLLLSSEEVIEKRRW